MWLKNKFEPLFYWNRVWWCWIVFRVYALREQYDSSRKIFLVEKQFRFRETVVKPLWTVTVCTTFIRPLPPCRAQYSKLDARTDLYGQLSRFFGREPGSRTVVKIDRVDRVVYELRSYTMTTVERKSQTKSIGFRGGGSSVSP